SVIATSDGPDEMASEGETSEGEGQEELSGEQCECLVGQKEDVERDWFEVFADR
ncbi:hypothetical protein Pmar_PMAR004903, partial [Perkinsus marinus ATCC 50983]